MMTGVHRADAHNPAARKVLISTNPNGTKDVAMVGAGRLVECFIKRPGKHRK